MKFRIHTHAYLPTARGDTSVLPGAVIDMALPLPSGWNPHPPWAEPVPDDTPLCDGSRDNRDLGKELLAAKMNGTAFDAAAQAAIAGSKGARR